MYPLAIVASTLATLPILALAQCPEGGPITISDKVLLNSNCTTITADCKKSGPLHPFVKDWECADAVTAAAGINEVLKQLDITSLEVAAAGISQMLGESGCFRMSHNHWGPLCSDGTGCDKGFLGKGTFAMFPDVTLAKYMVSEGIFTVDQLAKMSSEQALQYIMGPTNIHAYGPELWFLTGDHANLINPEMCKSQGDWLGELKKGNLDPWRMCLASTKDLSQAVNPKDHYAAVSSAMVQYTQVDSCKFTATPTAAIGYPSGVPAVNAGTVVTTTPTIVPLTPGAINGASSGSGSSAAPGASTPASNGSASASGSGSGSASERAESQSSSIDAASSSESESDAAAASPTSGGLKGINISNQNDGASSSFSAATIPGTTLSLLSTFLVMGAFIFVSQ